MELGSKPIRKRSKKRQSIDLPFLILTILLLSIGLITLFSASYVDAINSTQSGDGAFYFKRQGMFALAGIVCMLAVAFVWITANCTIWPSPPWWFRFCFWWPCFL